MTGPAFIEGKTLILRPLSMADASDAYLAWLNDAEVLRYRGPKAFPSRRADMERFLERIQAGGDLHLAVCLRATGVHVGNLSLNSINWPHGHCELSIMIGARDQWGKGIGREAIDLATRHAFRSMGLRRLWAESPNPGFNAVVKRLGWKQEGVKRQAFLLDGNHVDIECWGLLKSEWTA
jgi:RimJ/RimL family protein N-acetyltransferase